MKTRFYLVKFTCVCGEYEFSSQTVLSLQPRQRIGAQIHNYFRDFYGERNLTEDNRAEGSYLYNGGEVMVKRIGYREVTVEQHTVLNELGLA
jgi:hypothetical protein